MEIFNRTSRLTKVLRDLTLVCDQGTNGPMWWQKGPVLWEKRPMLWLDSRDLDDENDLIINYCCPGERILHLSRIGSVTFTADHDWKGDAELGQYWQDNPRLATIDRVTFGLVKIVRVTAYYEQRASGVRGDWSRYLGPARA